MTTEKTLSIALPIDDGRRTLAADIVAAAARARKAEPGDREDVNRYEALCSELEVWAVDRIGAEGVTTSDVMAESSAATFDHPMLPSVTGDVITVTVCMPLETGATDEQVAVGAKAPPRTAWKSPDGSTGKRATHQRFEGQCAAAVVNVSGDRPQICPSGINNSVITDVLREYVALEGVPLPVLVEYRDGSRARHPFMFRGLSLVESPPASYDLELRLALLSIRHIEMDPIVDGSWLRNSEVSKQRTHAETDEYVYGTSVRQLRKLTRDGSRRVSLTMYQTGLEPAVVGFYRAVVDHLRVHPSSVTVTPVYFEARDQGYRDGKLWSTGTLSAET